MEIGIIVEDDKIDIGELDDGLEAAVLISLFSDARVTDDEMPPEEKINRGWWGDLFEESPIGSKLWLLKREKKTAQNIKRVKEYALECLQWLVDDGAASLVEVDLVEQGEFQVLVVEISKPNQPKQIYKFNLKWNERK